ncbi:hypothetical protein OG474_30575 [Kribbella sp. NBC_01505]|uniref:hypothetical protein n=1 Tax=Kribbella sp. NBC_01505 TaxID=2903580 RepID=UPI003865EDE2
MEYSITPSHARDNGTGSEISRAYALEAFLSTFRTGTLCDLGPAMTCTEAEVLAELFVEHGRHAQADAVRAGHIEHDTHEDLNHNTGDEFRISDPELAEDMPGTAWVYDEAMGLYPTDLILPS